jgi:hypothetical protein
VHFFLCVGKRTQRKEFSWRNISCLC